MIPKDPVILLSFVNTALRDKYASLEAMCEDLDINVSEIEAKLSSINYVYDSDSNQFK